MQVKITSQIIKGYVNAPASKSVMQRACAAALLRSGTTTILNYGRSNDDHAALNIIRQLGAEVIIEDETQLKITAGGSFVQTQPAHINCGESGLSLRMFTPIAALFSTEVVVEGEGSLLLRPIHFFESILPGLGVAVQTNEDHLPIQLNGMLQPKDCTIDGGITSQFLTGLLMSFSAANTAGASITVDNLKSKPYVDLTLKVMEDFGMQVPLNHDYKIFEFHPKGQQPTVLPDFKYTIEGDWSNAAFFMVAGAIAGGVVVKGLDVFTAQADKKILEALQDCGCRLSIQMEQIEVNKHNLNAFHFDATDCPDLFPPLLALATHCKGTSVIEGVHRLQHKESNRAETLQSEFAKLGVHVSFQDDKMIIENKGLTNVPVIVDSHNDHRIAMSLAIAALALPVEIEIINAEAVNKSFPDFFEKLNLLSDKRIAEWLS